MDTNTVSASNVNKTVVTEIKLDTSLQHEVKIVKTKPKKATKVLGKLGRKPTAVTEIVTADWTIADLEKANPTVKSPTIRAFVARNVEAGRYVVTGTRNTGGRGKPANIYNLKKA